RVHRTVKEEGRAPDGGEHRAGSMSISSLTLKSAPFVLFTRGRSLVQSQVRPSPTCVQRSPEAGTELRAERGGLLDEGVGFGQSRRCLERVEDLPGLLQRIRGFGRLPESGPAAALPEAGERALGDDAELFPAVRRLGVALDGRLVVAARLGKGGTDRHSGVCGEPIVARVAIVRKAVGARTDTD